MSYGAPCLALGALAGKDSDEPVSCGHAEAEVSYDTPWQPLGTSDAWAAKAGRAS